MIVAVLALGAGWATSNPETLAKGREVYEAACLLCHGKDGAGNPEWESKIRPVSFADCSTTAEPSAQWEAITTDGGADHGLADVMPSFREAYPKEDIRAVVAYLRTFCKKADKYPPGDLNFRRAMATGKAFPESEVVIQGSRTPKKTETELEVSYENRVGPRFHYEIELPIRPTPNYEHYTASVGDLTIAAKYVLTFKPDHRWIASGGLEVTFPTGNEKKHFSAGTTVFTPVFLFGKGIRGGALQGRFAMDLPADTNRAASQYSYALAYSFPAFGFSKTGFVPAIEFVGAYNPDNGADARTIVLSGSKALSRLGHVVASVGLGIPLRPVGAPHPKEMRVYLQWDVGDGPFWKGW